MLYIENLDAPVFPNDFWRKISCIFLRKGEYMKDLNIRKAYGKYVSQNVLSMVGFSLYVLGDTYFVAKALGSNGLAALNFSISIYHVLNGFGLMLAIGGGTDYSITKEREKDYKKSFTHTVFLGLIFSIISVISGAFFANPITKLLGSSGETYPLTSVYIRTILMFGPFFLFNNIMLAFIRNDGNPSLPMIAMLVSSIANVVLDYVFMFPLGMGMFGAAFATGLSPVIGLAINFTHILRKNNKFKLEKIKIKLIELRKIVAYGFSSFIVEMATSMSLITFNLVILGISGNIGVGAYGVVANVALIATAIFVGIAQGLQPLASRAYGLEENGICNKIFKYTWMTTGFFVMLIYGFVYLQSPNITAFFNSEGNIQLAEIATEGLVLYFIGYFFAGFNIVSIAYLSAIAKAKSAMTLSVLRSVVILVPMVILLSKLLGMRGVWFSYVVTELLVFVLMIYMVKRNWLTEEKPAKLERRQRRESFSNS